MADKEEKSEKKILQAAIYVFLEKGYDGARMQKIADIAGINKALLHYYYKNKQTLFIASFNNLMGHFLNDLSTSMQAVESLPDIVRTLADQQLTFFRKRPKLPIFLLMTLHHHPHLVKEVIHSIKFNSFADLLIAKIASYKDINQQEAKIWLITFICTRLMPFAGAELFKTILNMDHKSYDALLDHQKEFSLQLFLNEDYHTS